MKKIIRAFPFVLLLFCFDAGAQVVTHTPNLNLNKPCVPGDPGCAPTGHPNYGPLLNENSDIIDAKLPTLNLTCTDGQVPAWANGKFSVCAAAGGTGTGHVIWGASAFAARAKLRFLGAGVALLDNAANDSTDVTITGTATNAVLNNQSNTYTGGDQNCSNCSSWTVPIATGAAPTLSGRIAYNSTSNRPVIGINGTTKQFAFSDEVQLLNTNLTALAGLTGAANVVPRFTGPGVMSNLVLPNCTATGTQAWNFDGTSIICGALSVGLTGTMTAGYIPKGVTAGTLDPSIMRQNAGNIEIAGGLIVGTCPPCLIWNAAALTVDRTVTVLDVSGTLRLSTGVLTPGNTVTTNASGQLIDGGAAGTGTWTDASVNTGTNKTLDESSNTLKITKSVQVELFGPTTDNASGNGQYYFRVPVSLNGTNLVGIQSNAVTAGTTGLASIQITRCVAVATSPLCSGTTASMLSTVVSIDSGETSSSTAATAAVINTANDDVATGQILRFDVTAIHATPAKGLFVNLDFKLP